LSHHGTRERHGNWTSAAAFIVSGETDIKPHCDMNQANPPDSSASSAQVTLDLEHLLPYRLSVLAYRVIHSISGEYHRRHGLAVTEWRTMAVLGRFPSLSASEVCEHTGMDKVAVSRAVARLLERGLLQRRIHSDDRRRSVLALSPAGVAVHDEIAPMVLSCEQELLSPLDQAEREQLDQLLTKLAGPGMNAMTQKIADMANAEGHRPVVPPPRF
jgi:DNA-binding MarR family transcriptional regulator